MNVKNISNNYRDKNHLFVSDVYKYFLKKLLLNQRYKKNLNKFNLNFDINIKKKIL